MKKISAVIRSPLLCGMYAKEDRKLMSQQQISKANKEAFLVLSQYNCDEQNAEGFIKKLTGSVNELLAKPDKTVK